MDRKDWAQFVDKTLAPLYPYPKPELHFENPFQLLVATVLSAQCTDERVNQVTPVLFEQFPDPQAMAKAERSELERIIYSTGFYHAKARSIQDLSRAILSQYNGQVPNTMEALTSLRGVGRKTAGVILSACYNVPALIVDTHVSRICFRLGFTGDRNPSKTESMLAQLYHQDQWITIGHCLNQHGRRVCTSRRPDCIGCPLSLHCPKTGVRIS